MQQDTIVLLCADNRACCNRNDANAQKDKGAFFPLKFGDAVSILAGTLGSHRLIAGNRATAVTRVQ